MESKINLGDKIKILKFFDKNFVEAMESDKYTLTELDKLDRVSILNGNRTFMLVIKNKEMFSLIRPYIDKSQLKNISDINMNIIKKNYTENFESSLGWKDCGKTSRGGLYGIEHLRNAIELSALFHESFRIHSRDEYVCWIETRA